MRRGELISDSGSVVRRWFSASNFSRLLRLAALLAVSLFQFAIYPGHGYLRGEGQILVPQIDRLQNPGMLTRDLVATHPNLTFTVLDETSLFFIRTTQISLKHSLDVQQFLARLAGILGLMMLCTVAGLTRWWSLGAASLAGFIDKLPGCQLALFGADSSPASIASGFAIVAAGFFACRKPLLAGLCGGIALLFDPPIAAPLWTAMLLATMLDRLLRPMLRSILTLLTVSILLLANFAQWQPATAETRGLLERIPPMIEAIQHFRTPELWVTGWQAREWLLYSAIAFLTLWALWILKGKLGRSEAWMVMALPACSAASFAFSVVLLNGLHLRAGVLLGPARIIWYTAACAGVLCCAAFARASRRDRWLFLAGPLLLLIASWQSPHADASPGDTADMAQWSRDNTWGGSMFLFADSGISSAPGFFRAQARRAVWVDWPTGSLCDSSDLFADEWLRRWHDTMSRAYQPADLDRLLTLPIDYVVLSHTNGLPGANPVYRDKQWLIYDARALRDTRGRGPFTHSAGY